jgi:hypothetical protein
LSILELGLAVRSLTDSNQHLAGADHPSNLVEAHRYFAAHCFNSAWDLIEKKDRTAADAQMTLGASPVS